MTALDAPGRVERRLGWSGAIAALLLAIALLAPTTASAFYGYGAQIVSADFARGEQGDDATTFAAISAAGRYVAIQTRARNFFADDDPDPPGRYRAGGIFRFDLETQGAGEGRRRRPLPTKRRTPFCAAAPPTPRSPPTGATSPSPPPSGSSPPTSTTTSTSTSAT